MIINVYYPIHPDSNHIIVTITRRPHQLHCYHKVHPTSLDRLAQLVRTYTNHDRGTLKAHADGWSWRT